MCYELSRHNLETGYPLVYHKVSIIPEFTDAYVKLHESSSKETEVQPTHIQHTFGMKMKQNKT